jgi:hypothetical protein
MKRKHPRYDPDRSPDAAWWSALPEGEQIEIVLQHHRKAGVHLPNANLHAVTHVVVENQVLLGDETPVASTLERLLQEGLSRHDAIHAIGTVLAPVILDILKGDIRSEPNLVYYQRLRVLTADSWLSEYS